MAKQRLGELLLAEGHVMETALQAALRHHEGNSIKLGQSLVELGICDEETMTRTVARQHGFDFIDLDSFPRQPQAIAKLPLSLMKRWYMFPVMVVNDELMVATICPPKKAALTLATYESGLKARPVIATVSALSRAIWSVEQKSGTAGELSVEY